MKINFFKILSYAEVVSFGKAQRNRQVKEDHVNDFYNVIKGGKSRVELEDGTYLVLGIVPVIVNPKSNNILEGQHRIEAFKRAHEKGDIDDNARLLVGFWEVEPGEAENRLTIDLNTKTKNWSVDDYISSYAQDLPSYAKLIEFCKTHTLCHVTTKKGERNKPRYAAAIITGKGCQNALKAGTFTFTDEQLKEADTIHKELLEIRKRLNMPLTGDEIEYMAAEWHIQRNFISAADIKALTYIPTDIKEKKVYNRKDWAYIFARLRDVISKNNLKKAA